MGLGQIQKYETRPQTSQGSCRQEKHGLKIPDTHSRPLRPGQLRAGARTSAPWLH